MYNYVLWLQGHFCVFLGKKHVFPETRGLFAYYYFSAYDRRLYDVEVLRPPIRITLPYPPRVSVNYHLPNYHYHLLNCERSY